MKYKPGDKVKIKTWEQIEEYQLSNTGSINCDNIIFLLEMEEELNKLNADRIVTIRKIYNYDYYSHDCYSMEEIGWSWTDNMIECLASEYKTEILEPILTRFEILDL